MRAVLAAILIALLTCPLEAQGNCPSTDDLLDELITPARTPRTTTFAWSCGFTVEPETVCRTFDRRAKRAGRSPLGVITVEADGVLYSHYVFVFMRESSGVRVNLVLTAHDRIIYKATAVLADHDFLKYRESLLAFSYLHSATKPNADRHNIVLWRDSTQSPPVQRIGEERHAERFADGLVHPPHYDDVFEVIVDPLLSKLTRTYGLHPPP